MSALNMRLRIVRELGDKGVIAALERRELLRRLNRTAWALVGLYVLSLASALLAIAVDAREACWLFLAAGIASSVTLAIVGVFAGRLQ